MQRKWRIATMGILGLGLVTLVAVLGTHGIDQMKSASAHSCVASICAGLSRPEFLSQDAALPATPSWRVLERSETDAVIAKLSRIHRIDTPKRYWNGSVLLDPWGRRYQIGVRLEAGRTEWIVWSFGPDGTSGTFDDIVMPQGVKPPVPPSASQWAVRDRSQPEKTAFLPTTLAQLVAATRAEAESLDVARVNLLCAEGLPGAEALDVTRCLATLDQWASRVKTETERHRRRFRDRPQDFDHSEGYFRMLMMAVVVVEDFGVRYNPAPVSIQSRPRS